MKKMSVERFRELRRMLQENGNEGVCPIWPDSPAGTIQTGDIVSPKRFWSPRAGGVFVIPADVLPNRIPITDDETRKRISSWIWEKNTSFAALDSGDEAEVPELTPATITEVSQRPLLSAEQRIDRGLHTIGRPPASLSDSLTLMLFQAATECGTDYDEALWLKKELTEAGFLRNLHQGLGLEQFVLTLKGLSRLETGGKALVANTVFVAMWFGDEVTVAYDSGIAPGIRDTGYKPIRIDRKEHSDRIDDQIIAEIRRARFLVCDFTCGLLPNKDDASGRIAVARGGVYYEAGFAHGLNKRAIFTCRNDLIDHLHFDLRQYNFIPWEVGKETDLRENLATRIRAVIP